MIISTPILLSILSLLVLSLSPYTPEIIIELALFILQMVIPAYLIEKQNLTLRDFNIYGLGIESIFDALKKPPSLKRITIDKPAITQELKYVTKISTVLLLPYCLIFLGYHQLFLASTTHFQWPSNVFLLVFTQVLAVALPEEFFYRGYLQSSLLKRLPIVPAVVTTNIIFALAHFVGTLNPSRLLTFFPGLVFSYLTLKNKSIFSAIIFHALCNIVGLFLALAIAS